MTRARNSANLASHGNLFVDIANDRTGIGSVVPAQNLHVAGTAGFHADTTFTGDLYNATWDRSENSLVFVDNAKVAFGDNSKATIHHSGSQLFFNNNQGNLYLRVGDENGVLIRPNADVKLYYNGTQTFATADYGVNVTGTTDTDGLIVSGVATVTTMNVTGVLTYDDVTSVDSVGIVTAREGVIIPDNKALSLGNRVVGSTAGDLRLYHDGSNSYIDEIGSGNLFIRNGSDTAIFCQTDGTVKLHYDGSEKLTTSSTGIDITGKIKATSNIEINADNGEFRCGAGDDFKISHSGSENILRSDSPTVFRNAANNETLATFTPNGNVVLYHNNTARLITDTTGITVNSRITASGDANTYINVGSSADTLDFFTGGSNFFRFDSSGRMLLNTITEGHGNADDLTIATTGHTGITLRSGTSNNGSVFFSDGTSGADEYRGWVQYTHTSNYLTFGTNASERLRIDNAGRLSLGVVASPGSYPVGSQARQVQAEIKGGISGNNYHHGSLALNCTNNNSNLHLVRSDNNQNVNVGLGNISFSGYDGSDFHVAAQISGIRDAAGGNNDIPGRLVFLTTADGASQPTERLRIDSSGNIWANYGNPVSGSLIILDKQGGGESAVRFYNASQNKAQIALDSSEELTFDVNGGERLRIDSSGFVGINQTSPTCQLQIDSGSSGAGTVTHLELNHKGNDTNDAVKLNFARAGSDIGSIVLEKVSSNNTTDFIFNTRSYNTVSESMRITGAGKVGINTDNPSQELTVYGTDPIISIQEATVSSQVDMGTGTSTGFINIQKADGTRTIQLNGSGDTYFNSGGKFFIGRTSASHSSSTMEILGGSEAYLRISPNTNTGTAAVVFGTNDDHSTGGIYYNGSDDSLVLAGHNNTERLRIASTGAVAISGNINQVAPSAYNDLTGTNQAGLIIGSSGITDAGIMLRTSTSGTGRIYFGDNSGSDNNRKQGQINYYNNGDYMQFCTSQNERLRITSGGDVRLNGGALVGDDSALPTFTIKNTDGNSNNCKITLGENVGSDNGGITFYTAGSSTSTARMRIRGNNNFIDILSSYTLRFNDGALKINHDGSHAYITAATGILHLRSDASVRLQDEGGSPMIYGYNNGAVELYHGMSGATAQKRLETTSTGVDMSGATDGVLNINTTDGRGSFIRLKQTGTTKVWVGSSEGFGIGDQDDGALMAVDNIYLMSGQSRRVTINGSGMAELYGGANSYPWGATFRSDTSGNNSVRCFFEGVNGQSNRTFSIMSENGKLRISGGGTAGSSTGTQLVYLSSTSATSWTGGSDIRLKENITEIPNVLDKIKNYRCARFNFIGDDASDIENIKFGFIAQDWVDDFPEVLSTSTQDADDPTDTTEYYGMQYTETIPVLLKAIQELNAKVETLQNEVNTLKSS